LPSERTVWRALAAIDGFAEGSSIFSDDDADRAYFVDGTQVANLHDGKLGLRLTRPLIRDHRPALKADPHVDLLRSGGDWIAVDIAAPPARIMELAELTAGAHRPPRGVTAKPPPTGSELDRRRRFH
jgi:hypothetical protein